MIDFIFLSIQLIFYILFLNRSRSHSYFRCGQELGRVPTHTRNVYRDKTPPPVVNTSYERAPTPEPDVIEKIYIKREPQQIYETIYERPKTPPPVVIEKTEVEAPPAALYTCKYDWISWF